MVKIFIPKNIEKTLCILQTKGEAYIVGGCVRDSLLGLKVNDYDITTNLLPHEIIELFKDYTIVNNNGLKHGTVSVIVDDEVIEITTFRTEGQYLDGRHPSSVSFTRNLKEDLMRRDFTINALAYNHEQGLIDYYDGINDLNNKIIRTVRDPYLRFSEDYLRILRALRFKAKLNFEIEEETKNAILDNISNLNKISKERIFKELSSILLADNIDQIINEYVDLFTFLFPKLKDCINFNQMSKYHDKDVFNHLLDVTVKTKKELRLRFAALFHDIGKPFCFSEETLENKTIRHFGGHAAVSYEIAKEYLEELKVPNDFRDDVLFLIYYHDYRLDTEKEIINILDVIKKEDKLELFSLLLNLKEADYNSHIIKSNLDYSDIFLTAKKIIDEHKLIQIKDLKINGYDLINLGLSGEDIGNTLNIIRNEIINENLVNDKEEILKFIKESCELNETN